MLRETGRDKAPDLIKNDRAGKKNTRRQRDFNLDEKCLGDTGADQILTRLEVLPKRRDDKIENRRGKKITSACGNDDGKNRFEQAPAEILEMLRQSHLRIARHSPESERKLQKGEGFKPFPFLVLKTYKVNRPTWFLCLPFSQVPQEPVLCPS